MVDLTVTFEVPARILNGLADGRFTRVGGVIVNRDGGVVAWLREGGASAVDSNSPLGLESLSLGLQVTTLAVSVVGFSLLYARLKAVEQQLKDIESTLAEQKRDGEWRDWKEMAARFVPVVASSEMVDGVHLIPAEETRRAILVGAIGELGKAKEYFRHVVTGMMDQRRETHRIREFETSYRTWVAASSAHVKAAEGVGGRWAANLCSSFLDRHREFSEGLRAAIGDYTRGLGADDWDRGKDRRKTLLDQASQVEEIFRGHVMRLEWEADNEISSLEFEPDPDIGASPVAHPATVEPSTPRRCIQSPSRCSTSGS